MNGFNHNRRSIISQGKNHSSSQQFAAGNNGIGDANTDLHTLERTTQLKEQQQQQGSVSGNQHQELMRENESQDHENIPSPVPQASNLQSRNKSISKPERPQPQYPESQKMSSQRAHCVEQPVGPEKAKVCELFCILVDLVDMDRKMQLRNLYYKFKVGLHIHAMTCLSLSSRTLNTLLFVSYLFAD